MAQLKKIDIIIEKVVLDRVIEEITNLGVKAYTVHNVEGKGGKGIVARSILDAVFGQTKIEVVIGENIARKISDMVMEKFLEHYAGVVYMMDVELPEFKQLNP